jgi:mRNA-degrading endonuclease toxin of MazEF toxin-antitoxin module
VVVGVEHGLKGDSAVNLDHVQTVAKSKLRRYVGSLDAGKMRAVCLALTIATGCEG